MGSILVEGPKATASGGGSSSLTCVNTDVVGTSQAASASLGQIDCATGTNGNTFTQSLGDLFANPAPDYTLKPGSTAIDSVPESALAPPAGITPSPTDLAGAARVVNGLDTCAAGLRDKGALELAGHEGVVPAAAAAGPPTVTAGTPAAFAASAPNVPAGTELTFAWAFSDGATASGPQVSHSFSAVGPASATVTVTAPGGCVGTATAALTVTETAAVLDRITGLKISPSAFFAKRSGASVVPAAKRPVGALVRYTGTQPALTTFTVQAAKAGRRQGNKCRKPSRKNRRGKRCTRYAGVGSFKHTDAAGAVRFRFTGRVRGHALKRGRYRLKAVPRNAAGSGRAVYRKFRIKGLAEVRLRTRQPLVVQHDVDLLVVERDEAGDRQDLTRRVVVRPCQIGMHCIARDDRPVAARAPLVRALGHGVRRAQVIEVHGGAVEVVARREAGLEKHHGRGDSASTSPSSSIRTERDERRASTRA